MRGPDQQEGIVEKVTFAADVWDVVCNVVRKSELVNEAIRAYLLDGSKAGHADRYRRQMIALEGALTLPEINPNFRTLKLRCYDVINGPFVVANPFIPPGFNQNNGVRTIELRHCPCELQLLDVMELWEFVPQHERGRTSCVFTYAELLQFAKESPDFVDQREKQQRIAEGQRAAARMDAAIRRHARTKVKRFIWSWRKK